MGRGSRAGPEACGQGPRGHARSTPIGSGSSCSSWRTDDGRSRATVAGDGRGRTTWAQGSDPGAPRPDLAGAGAGVAARPVEVSGAGGARRWAGEGRLRAPRASAAAGGGRGHVAASYLWWRCVRQPADVSGRAEREIRDSGSGDPGMKWRGLYIGVEGARKLQMRCGLRPRDRDRTVYMMEEV